MPTLKKCNKRKYIQYSDPGKILDLVMSLTDETCALLQSKINTYLKEECDADIVFHIIVQIERQEAFIECVGTNVLPKKMKLKMSPKYDAVLKSSCEVSELLRNFETDVQNIVDPYVTHDSPKKRTVMFPLLDKPFSLIFCVVSPKIQEEAAATFIQECSLFIWPTVKKTLALEYECMLKQKCQVLLRSTRKLVAQTASLPEVLRVATQQLKILTKAENCVIILIDVAKMDLYNPRDPMYVYNRFSMSHGITGEVIRTGRLINSRDPKNHPAFDSRIDNIPEQNCSNILCIPIRERAGIIGAAVLINKVEEPYFDVMDEEMAQSFSIYCGMCIVHSTIFGKIQEAHIRNALASELMMYHLKYLNHWIPRPGQLITGPEIKKHKNFNREDGFKLSGTWNPVIKILKPKNTVPLKTDIVEDRELASMVDCKGFHDHPDLVTLDFNPRALALKELPCYVLRMFTDLGLDKKFQIKRTVLCRFILHVRKGYRDVPYHSWLHCFNTVQWMYAAIINFKLHNLYTDLQLLMFLVAALMHDLDHRGTTNSFQLHGKTTLAALYSSEGSVLERHHLSQALCILNMEGCDILVTLSRRDYDRALIMLRDLIVATDVTNFIDKMEEYREIASDFMSMSREHMSALSALIINCADFSDQLKEWSSVKKTAASALTEFFKQSEVEKSRGEVSAIRMDKDKFCIPDLEMQFLKEVCIPMFEILGMILPQLNDYTHVMVENIEKWDNARTVFAEIPATAGIAVILSPELDNLIELNIKEREMEIERERERQEAAEAEAAAAAAAEERKKNK